MNVYVVTIEYSLTNPDPSLGDEKMCPLFHNISSRCPVLHLFGYVYTTRPGEDRPHVSKTETAAAGTNILHPRSICVHVHGVYPYFMVLQHDSRVTAMQFGAQLETVAIKALKVLSLPSTIPPRVLHHVEVVQRVPFYGYHAKPKSFYKVSVVDPAMVGKLSHLLCCTTQVGGRYWQTYEAHAPYHFQFMVDYGLKGMAPFSIPICTARAPVPSELQTAEAQAYLHVAGVMPSGEPVRLTRAELEVDVAVSAFHRQDAPMEPGENLLSVRRGVRQYFADFGVDDAMRRGAVSDLCVRDSGVGDVQNCDLAVAVMRQQALTYLRARAKTVTTQFSSNMVSIPMDKLKNTASPPLFDDTSGDNLTLRLMEEIRGDRRGPTLLPSSASFASSASSASASSCSLFSSQGGDVDAVLDISKGGQSCVSFSSLPSLQPAQDEIEDEGEHSLFSSENESVQEVFVSDGASLVVGDSIVLFNVRADGETPHPLLMAKITRINSQSVRLRWYMTLRETHLADCQDELEKNGRWLGKGMIHASGITFAREEELLLGDVEDENPIDVLKQSSRVIVCHSYRECKNSELLCRYNYHVFEKRLSTIEVCLNNNNSDVVAFPAALLSPVSNDMKKTFLGEDEELFSTLSLSSVSSLTSFSSSHFSTSESPALPSTTPPPPPPPPPPSSSSSSSSSLICLASSGVNSSPIVVKRSLSRIQQEVEQSQLSLLLSCTGLSPLARSQVSLFNASHTEAPLEITLSSSVECVDPCKEAFLQNYGQNASHLKPCYFINDVPRCFQWTHDQQRNCVVVSAASWPFATPVPRPISEDFHDAKRTTLMNTARPSVPLLTHVAGSQRTPLGCRRSVDVKSKRRPHLSLNASCSVDSCAYATCSLRVMCVEVLIHRRHGEQCVAQEELLAVALGQTTSTDDTVGVRLFCVYQPKMVVRRMKQPFSGAVEVVYVQSESCLLRRVVNELRRYDPDIILSWEGVKYGIGFFALRYHTVLHRSFARDFSRLVKNHDDNFIDDDDDDDDNNNNNKGINEEGDEEEMDSCASHEAVLSLSSMGEDGNSVSKGGLTSRATFHSNKEKIVKRVLRRFGSSVRIVGRIVIDLGKQLRKELNLPSHTLQMVHQKLFHRSLPYFTDVALAGMYTSSDDATRRVALSVLLTRVVTPHRIAQHLNFYTRTAEFSRMYGILFYEVLSRGSQYRVEATLHRMAKPMGYAMLSPPLEQVHRQPRQVGIPLIMQPCSGFYKDEPIVVLDFRSLYPSIVIAYNLCYSTCLGKISKGRRCCLGVMRSYRQADSLLLSLLEADDSCKTLHRVTIAPNGCMFLSPAIRKGVLPEMLRALLETRLEVLAALNYVAQPHGDMYMQRVLHEQQAAIKMLANTTYGYTAASFTGRMPCVDVADAIVMLGRQTLGRAMQLINGHPKWNAEVVYGDTDSVFVRLPGRTKEEAFLLGEQIAKEVTAINPSPIKLQFEKVLLPCLLLVKKRYVGYAYFKADQKEPQFFAKGIETVRRDQCPATSRLTACMIQALFSGASTEALRMRFYEEVGKVLRGECNPVDCIFHRAVKLNKYRHKRNMPLGAHLVMQLMEKDITHTPYWGERLPYIVVQSMESSRLRDQVVHPQLLLSLEKNLRIDSDYYIKRHIIPTLDRIFYLVGVSCASWYAAMPRRRSYRGYFDLGITEPPLTGKKTRRNQNDPIMVDVDVECDSDEGDHFASAVNLAHCAQKRTLDAYYQQMICAVCLENFVKATSTKPPICSSCLCNRAVSIARVIKRRCDVERHLRLLETACRRCIGSCGEVGGPNFVAGMERDMEDIHFNIPHQLAAATCHGEKTECCVSIDCHLSFEKRHMFQLYSQLITLERYITRL